MIVGDPSVFAIESEITQAYWQLGLRAIGLFVIHIGGRRYGVYSRESTYLACSFDEVERRLSTRGMHEAPFAADGDAAEIAGAFREALFAEIPREQYFGLSRRVFRHFLYSHHLIWAPDGDAAFDDGSYVFQFDVGERVRLIGFKSKGPSYDPASFSEVWLAADTFYDVLQYWQNSFKSEWAAAPKL